MTTQATDTTAAWRLRHPERALTLRRQSNRRAWQRRLRLRDAVAAAVNATEEDTTK